MKMSEVRKRAKARGRARQQEEQVEVTSEAGLTVKDALPEPEGTTAYATEVTEGADSETVSAPDAAAQERPEPEVVSAPVTRKYAEPDLQVVVFKMADHEYVVDVALVQEIIRPTDLMDVDNVPEYVDGIMKRRGRLVPVVDLRKRLGLTVNPLTAETCVIIARLPIGPVGFTVDSASELAWVKTRDFEVPSPVVAGVDRAYLQGMAHLGDRFLVMLNLERLLTPHEQHALGELDMLRPDSRQGEPAAEPTLDTLFAGQTDVDDAEAERLQVRAGLRSLMAFDLGGEMYGVPVTEVAEIREPRVPLPLPHAPPHVLGLINLRGVVLPVIDLRRRYGLPLKPDGPDRRLIILKGQNHPLAFLVDRVYGMTRLPSADFQPAPPGVARIDPEYYDQVVTVDGRILIELNVRRMLAHARTGVERTAPGFAEVSPGAKQ